MKVSEISTILDIALAARKNGGNLVPMIRGDAGLGKSAGVKAWVKKQKETNAKFGYYDLRAALIESPDLQGLPYQVKNADGSITMYYAKPNWMHELGENGVLFVDELNRGKSDTANGFMQLLTEREVGGHKLSPGVIVVAAVNPDNGNYDVSTMDTALADRVITVDVEYDSNEFKRFIRESNWHPFVQAFIEQDLWVYTAPAQIGTSADAKFVSPRTWDYVNQAMLAGADTNLNALNAVCEGTLGRAVGKAFYAFVTDQKPLLADDFRSDKKAALKRLKSFGEASTFRGDLVSTLVDSIGNAYEGNGRGKKINNALIRDIMALIPIEYATNILKKVDEKQESTGNTEWLKDFKEGDVAFWDANVKARLTADGVSLDKLFPDEYNIEELKKQAEATATK